MEHLWFAASLVNIHQVFVDMPLKDFFSYLLPAN